MSRRSSSSRNSRMASPLLLDEVKNAAETIQISPRSLDSGAPYHKRESQANLSLTSPSSLSLMTCHCEKCTETRNSSSSQFREMLAEEGDGHIAADLNNSSRNSPIPIVSPSDDSEGSDPLEALGGFYQGEEIPIPQDEVEKKNTYSKSLRRRPSIKHTNAFATEAHTPLPRAVSSNNFPSSDSRTNRHFAVSGRTSPHLGSHDYPWKDALVNLPQPPLQGNVQEEEKEYLVSPHNSPLPLSLAMDASRGREVEDRGKEGKRIPHVGSRRFDESHHHGLPQLRNGRNRHVWHSDHRWRVEPSIGTAFFFAWDGAQKSRWIDPGSPVRDEEFVNDPAFTLVLLEPPLVTEDEEDEDDGGTLKGDGGFSHLIHTADASYVAYLEFIKHQRQVEKMKNNQKKDEHEWQVLRYINKVVSDIRKTSKKWTMARILWIIFLLLLLTVGNFLQIIMLNFWLVSFPPEVKGSNYVVFALPGILYFIFFFGLQIVHLIRFRPDMSFAKNFSSQFLLFGVGFMDAINSWMAAYAASYTSEVLQALFMNLSPIFAVFMSKTILRDNRRYCNRWVITVFFLTIIGVLCVTIYSFATSSSAGKIVWILIYFASIPLRVLQNVWQSLYMIVYTYDSTFNEWLERKYVEEVVENAIRLQQGDSALSKNKMRRRRKKVLRKKRVNLLEDKVGNGKSIKQVSANDTKLIFPSNYSSERQDTTEFAGYSSGAFSPTGVHGASNTFSSSTAVPPFAMEARASIDGFSGVFSYHFPVDVHPQNTVAVEELQTPGSEVFQSDDMQPTNIVRYPRPPDESVLQSPNFSGPKTASSHPRTHHSRRWNHRTTEEHRGDRSIPVPTSDFLSPSEPICGAAVSHSRIRTGKNELVVENAQQHSSARRLENEKTESGQFLLSDDDQNNESSSDDEYTYYYVNDCEGGDEATTPRGENLRGLKDERSEAYYLELDPEEVLEVLRSGAAEVILKGKEREILLEVFKSSENEKGSVKDSDDLRYIMRTDPRQQHSMPLTQQRRNIIIGTGMNLGSRRKARGYNPEFHFSPYQEHYRSLQTREGDDLSVKIHMLFGDTLWQLVISLALMPADALPWFGRSHSVKTTWRNFCEGVTYVFTRKTTALYGVLYTLGFLFNYIGAAYLNHYSVALCSMVTQLSSPITALILVIIPSWNKNSDGTPPWYLSLLSIIFLSIAAFFYVLWEEKTDDEKKEAEMQLKRYKLKL